MKVHTYEIELTKSRFGEDRYQIKNVWFGFFRTSFSEIKLSKKTYHSVWPYIQHVSFYYHSYDKAIEALHEYLDNPSEEYRGRTLTRCHGGLFVDLSSGEKPHYNSTYYEYRVFGSLKNCKEKIDEYFQKKEFENFKEVLNIR